MKKNSIDLGMIFGQQQADIRHSTDTLDGYPGWHMYAGSRHCPGHMDLTLSKTSNIYFIKYVCMYVFYVSEEQQ